MKSRLFLLDYTRAAHERGLTPLEFLDCCNPAFTAGEQLRPYTTEAEFAPGRYQVAVINNGCLPVAEAVAFIRDHVDDVVLVSDARMVEAMRLLFRHAGVAIEPSGAAGIAAIMDASRATQPVATILCGGNVRPDLMRELAAGGGHRR